VIFCARANKDGMMSSVVDISAVPALLVVVGHYQKTDRRINLHPVTKVYRASHRL
jgi:hypothetical protein